LVVLLRPEIALKVGVTYCNRRLRPFTGLGSSTFECGHDSLFYLFQSAVSSYLVRWPRSLWVCWRLNSLKLKFEPIQRNSFVRLFLLTIVTVGGSFLTAGLIRLDFKSVRLDF